MTEKETMFCYFYTQLPTPRLAAAKAGYHRQAERTAAKLLTRADIQAEIRRQRKALGLDAVRAGLWQLAFGSAADALRLLLEEEPPSRETLEQMDLFNIAEVKRPRNGGMEIKFYDRAKALDRLLELAEQQAGENSPFFEALRKGAEQLRACGEGSHEV